jgi:hypothetical protein
MSAGILREMGRDDEPACMTQPVPDMDVPAAEDAAPSLIAALWQDLFQWRVLSGCHRRSIVIPACAQLARSSSPARHGRTSPR